jgi:putative DNA primase/helicase
MTNDTTDETELAATARIYVRAGWKVFPLWWVTETWTCACPKGRLSEDDPNFCGRRADGEVIGSPGKHPLHHLAPNGVKNATDDEETVAGWWQLYPHANIGLPADANGLAILDIDTDKGGAESFAKLTAYLEAQGRPLPQTLSVITGSGGRHLFFKAPEGGIKSGSNVLGPNMPGIDTRGRGGYVVAAPSNHAKGGTYTWENFLCDEADWPDIMAQLMAPKPIARPAVTLKRQTGGDPLQGSVERWANAALDAEVQAVASTSSNRNDRLNQAAFSLGQIVAGGHLDRNTVGNALLDAALSTGLGEHEARKTIISGFRSSQGNPRHPSAVAA